jgi:hypothetical protein
MHRAQRRECGEFWRGVKKCIWLGRRAIERPQPRGASCRFTAPLPTDPLITRSYYRRSPSLGPSAVIAKYSAMVSAQPITSDNQKDIP